jgi:hypothetical protein
VMNAVTMTEITAPAIGGGYRGCMIRT